MASETEKKKRSFRNSSLWKKFRNYISNKFGHKDPISGKPLRKGYSVHHLDLAVENYEKLVEENFIPLNKKMHEILHICYNYQKSDKEFMDRLKMWVDIMVRINSKK